MNRQTKGICYTSVAINYELPSGPWLIALTDRERMAVVAALVSPECTDRRTQLGCKVGILGKGDERMYPSRRVPAHPLSALGLAALGKNLGENGVWRYQGLTAI